MSGYGAPYRHWECNTLMIACGGGGIFFKLGHQCILVIILLIILVVVLQKVSVGRGILAEGAKALSVTLSGGVLFAS